MSSSTGSNSNILDFFEASSSSSSSSRPFASRYYTSPPTEDENNDLSDYDDAEYPSHRCSTHNNSIDSTENLGGEEEEQNDIDEQAVEDLCDAQEFDVDEYGNVVGLIDEKSESHEEFTQNLEQHNQSKKGLKKSSLLSQPKQTIKEKKREVIDENDGENEEVMYRQIEEYQQQIRTIDNSPTAPDHFVEKKQSDGFVMVNQPIPVSSKNENDNKVIEKSPKPKPKMTIWERKEREQKERSPPPQLSNPVSNVTQVLSNLNLSISSISTAAVTLPPKPKKTIWERLNTGIVKFNQAVVAGLIIKENSEEKKRSLFEKLVPHLNTCWAMTQDELSVVDFKSVISNVPTDMKQYSIVDFKKAHADKVVILYKPTSGDSHNQFKVILTELWLKSPDRLHITLEFNPTHPITQNGILDNYLDRTTQKTIIPPKPIIINVFRGLDYTAEKCRNYVQLHPPMYSALLDHCPIARHLFEIICDSNRLHFDFMLKWLAYILQYKKKTSVAIILSGQHGAGKGLFVRILQIILGDDSFQNISNFERSLRYNCVYKYSLISFIDEVRKMSTDQYEMFKNLVSEDTIEYSFPNKRAKKDSNESYVNFIISNNATEDGLNIPIEPKERRFVILRVSNKYANKTQESADYFIQLKQAPIEPFAHHLYNLPLGNFDPHNRMMVPQMEIPVSLDKFTRFWHYCIREKCIPNKSQNHDRWQNDTGLLISKKKLFLSFLYTVGAKEKVTEEMASLFFKQTIRLQIILSESRPGGVRCVTLKNVKQAKEIFEIQYPGLNWTPIDTLVTPPGSVVVPGIPNTNTNTIELDFSCDMDD